MVIQNLQARAGLSGFWRTHSAPYWTMYKPHIVAIDTLISMYGTIDIAGKYHRNYLSMQ